MNRARCRHQPEIIGRNCHYRIIAGCHVIPGDGERTARIGADQCGSRIKIHLAHCAITVGSIGSDCYCRRFQERCALRRTGQRDRWRTVRRRVLEDREVVIGRARGSEELRIEPVGVDVKHQRAEMIERHIHRRVVQQPARGLTRTAGHNVHRAFVRRQTFGLGVGAGSIFASSASVFLHLRRERV